MSLQEPKHSGRHLSAGSPGVWADSTAHNRCQVFRQQSRCCRFGTGPHGPAVPSCHSAPLGEQKVLHRKAACLSNESGGSRALTLGRLSSEPASLTPRTAHTPAELGRQTPTRVCAHSRRASQASGSESEFFLVFRTDPASWRSLNLTSDGGCEQRVNTYCALMGLGSFPGGTFSRFKGHYRKYILFSGSYVHGRGWAFPTSSPGGQLTWRRMNLTIHPLANLKTQC